MKQIVIAHALGVTPEFTWGDAPGLLWYPAAQEALIKKGSTVKIPALPDANHPRLGSWTNALHTAVDSDPASTVLIGHSVGGIAVLRYLESLDLEEPFAEAILVATNVFDVGYAEITAEFLATAFQYERIKKNVRQVVAISAIDDPVLAPDPVKHGLVLLQQLGAKLIVLPHGGHFTPFDDCRDLLEEIETSIDRLG